MNEIRVDPLTGLKTIVAGGRAERPGGWPIASEDAALVDPAGDPFAPGNEEQTPPEIAADRAEGSAEWRVRVVPNKYPALVADGDDAERSHVPELFTATPARGAHEVIVNAPDPVTSLGALNVEQVGRAMAMWRERMRAHASTAAYVHLLVNERVEGGASLPHTHAQLYALDFVPKVRLDVLVADDQVDAVITAIGDAARTGKIGDGKVWSTSVGQVLRVRTAELGDDAI